MESNPVTGTEYILAFNKNVYMGKIHEKIILMRHSIYLATRFVRSILEKDEFDRIISYDVDDVKRAFHEFISSL